MGLPSTKKIRTGASSTQQEEKDTEDARGTSRTANKLQKKRSQKGKAQVFEPVRPHMVRAVKPVVSLPNQPTTTKPELSSEIAGPSRVPSR